MFDDFLMRVPLEKQSERGVSGVGTEHHSISIQILGPVKGGVVPLSQKTSSGSVQEIARHVPANVRQAACDAARLQKQRSRVYRKKITGDRK
jgi:hypothetical protein